MQLKPSALRTFGVPSATGTEGITIKDREEIYISDALRKAMDKRSVSLSTGVNLIAERYLGIIERQRNTPMMDYHAELYCNVLREVGTPLSAQQIAAFPSLCADWLARHPKFPQEPGKTALMILNHSTFAELVARVDRLERQL